MLYLFFTYIQIYKKMEVLEMSENVKNFKNIGAARFIMNMDMACLDHGEGSFVCINDRLIISSVRSFEQFFPCLMNWKRLILPITMSLKFLRLCSGSISRSLLATLNSCLLVPTWPLITSRSLKSLNIWFLELRMILLCLIFLMLDWKLFALKASPNWLRNSWSTTDSEPSKPRVFYNAGLHFFIILYFYFVVTSIDSIIISFTGLDNSPEDDNVFSVWAILSTTSIPDITWPNTV